MSVAIAKFHTKPSKFNPKPRLTPLLGQFIQSMFAPLPIVQAQFVK